MQCPLHYEILLPEWVSNQIILLNKTVIISDEYVVFTYYTYSHWEITGNYNFL